MIYDQICPDCKKRFKHEAPMSEGPTRVCPKEGCGGMNCQIQYDKLNVQVHNGGYSPVHPRKWRGRGGAFGNSAGF